MQVGGVQGLRGAPGAGHEHAHFGKRAFGFQAGVLNSALHVLQISTAVARFVLAEFGVNGFDHRLGMPLAGAAVPVVEANFAAKVQHQRLQRGRWVKLEAHVVQLGLGGHQLGAKAAQVFHQHQRVFLLFKKPDRHKGRKVAVALVVAQKHLSGRQRRPLGDGVHLDGGGLLVGERCCVKAVPGNVALHVPAHGFELSEEFGIKHVGLSKGG